MTFIDFFVASYYFKKGYNAKAIQGIINSCSNQYSMARDEYNAMKKYYTIDGLVTHVRKNLKGSTLEKFNQKY